MSSGTRKEPIKPVAPVMNTRILDLQIHRRGPASIVTETSIQPKLVDVGSADRNWSGRWESNPRLKLGKLGYYHYTTPATRLILVGFHGVGKSLVMWWGQFAITYGGSDRSVTQQITLLSRLAYH